MYATQTPSPFGTIIEDDPMTASPPTRPASPKVSSYLSEKVVPFNLGESSSESPHKRKRDCEKVADIFKEAIQTADPEGSSSGINEIDRDIVQITHKKKVASIFEGEIGTAQRTDAPAIVSMLKEVTKTRGLLPFEPGDFSTEGIEKTLRKVGDLAIVARLKGVEDEVAGFLFLKPYKEPKQRHVAKLHIAIAPEFQGKGIGPELMEEAESRAASRGIHRIELFVRATNERAIKLYRNMGYIVEGLLLARQEVDGHYVDDMILAKQLSPIESI